MWIDLQLNLSLWIILPNHSGYLDRIALVSALYTARKLFLNEHGPPRTLPNLPYRPIRASLITDFERASFKIRYERSSDGSVWKVGKRSRWSVLVQKQFSGSIQSGYQRDTVQVQLSVLTDISKA